MDENSFILLRNVSMSTLAAPTVQANEGSGGTTGMTTITTGNSTASTSTADVLNKNITLYIVVKPPGDNSTTSGNVGTEAEKGKSGHEESHRSSRKHSTTSSGSEEKEKGSKSDSGETSSDSSESDHHEHKKQKQREAALEKKRTADANYYYGLTVAAFVGILSIIMLATLIHKRWQLSKRSSNY